ALRRAITAGQLVLYYQPILDCHSGHLTGLEALVRWHDPQRGLIPPDQFIPLAEETGLIKPLTRWVLQAALRQSRAWRDQGMNLRIAVNLSGHDIQDPTLPDTIASYLTEYGLDSTCLTVGLTETALMADAEHALATLERLGETGVAIAIDDF